VAEAEPLAADPGDQAVEDAEAGALAEDAEAGSTLVGQTGVIV